MVPADSRRVSRAPRYSGIRLAGGGGFAYGAVTRYGRAFLRVPLPHPAATLAALQPRARLDAPGLGSCAVARRYWRNHSYFLFLRVLGCFGSPRSPRACGGAAPGLLPAGFPIRTSAGRWALAPRRGFSQLVTSFVASESRRHPPRALDRLPFVWRPAAPLRGGGRVSCITFSPRGLSREARSILYS